MRDVHFSAKALCADWESRINSIFEEGPWASEELYASSVTHVFNPVQKGPFRILKLEVALKNITYSTVSVL